jgi:hypothetical protein
VPSDKWQLQRQAGDPGSIASTGLIYTKDGGSGISELYYENDNGTPDIVQLTTTDGIGGLSQKVYTNNVVMKPGAVERSNPQQAFCCAYGVITGATGDLGAGSYNITSSVRNSAGNYTITWNFTATGQFTYLPIVSVRKLGSSQLWGSYISNQQTTSVIVKTFEINFGSGDRSFSDADFCIAVFGAFT